LKESIDKSLFVPINVEVSNKENLSTPNISYLKNAWILFKKNRGALIGLVIIFLIAFLAFFAPLLSSYDYQTQDLNIQNKEPFGTHYFGTDNFGRDIWVRTWYGAKISLLIAFLAAFLDLVIGVTFGGISGYFGGKVDLIMQRIIEILYSIPNLILIILMLLIFKPGIVPIAVSMSFTGWVPMARIVRAQVLKLKSYEYVLASKTLGASHFRLLFKHLIPNAMGPIIIAVTFAIPTAIFFEAFLSFIGLGIRPPEASLGVLINEARNYLQIYPYQLFYPAVVLSLLMLSFNLVGDALRDAFDPRLRK